MSVREGNLSERMIEKMDELSSISDILLVSIQEEMQTSPSIFNLWFNEFKLASLTDDKAVFTTPSAIKKNILSTKYHNLIAKSLVVEKAQPYCVTKEME